MPLFGCERTSAKRFKKVENAQAVIWKMLLVAEQRFRRLKAPELMKDVYQGAKYVNGVPVNQVPEEKACFSTPSDKSHHAA